MGRPRLSDLATPATCDWRFMEEVDLMARLRAQAAGLARRQGLDPDDVLQETCLWLAARPHLHSRSHAMILGQTRAVAQGMGLGERKHEHAGYPEDE